MLGHLTSGYVKLNQSGLVQVVRLVHVKAVISGESMLGHVKICYVSLSHVRPG
jgi:hypothetical protein